MTAGPTSQPDPDAHGAQPSAPRRPHRLPRRTARTLQVACRRQNPSHQALPLSNVPARPQHRGRGAPSSAGGSAKARLPATLHLPPLPHAQQHPCRGRPLLPSDTSSPQTSTFQAFLFPPQGHGPIPLHQAALPLQPPSLHLPSPGAGQQGRCPLRNWPLGPSREERGRGGAPRLPLPGSSEPRREGEGATADLLSPTSFQGQQDPRGKPAPEEGQGGGLRGLGPRTLTSPLSCAHPPAQRGKPRSSHRSENRATKCDQTQ